MRERQVCDMGGGIYSTGNTIVDENAKLNISGNIIPQTWYRTVVRESGKPNLTAIVILADIVYWYRPTEIRDESTGQVVALKKNSRLIYCREATSRSANSSEYRRKKLQTQLSFWKN